MQQPPPLTGRDTPAARPAELDAGVQQPSLPDASPNGADDPPPLVPEDAGPSAQPDAAAPPPPDAGELSGCVPEAERCDGRDNDCDQLIDETGACASDCAGLLLQGRSAMYCAGAGHTFAVAQSRCAAEGMRVLRIESAPENDALVQGLAPLYDELSTLVEEQASVWLDAQDVTTEGTWLWVTEGTSFWLGAAAGAAQNGAYVNWASGKPNNSGSGAGEDCAVVYVNSGPDPVGSWNDHACDTLHSFLCEAVLAAP